HAIGSGTAAEFQFRNNGSYAAIDLAPVRIPFHGDIHHGKALLIGVRHFGSHEDGAGAGAKDGFGFAEVHEGFFEIHQIEQLEHGRAFTAGDDQPVDSL